MAQPKKKTTICEASIVAAAFNATRTQLAFSPNNDTVMIVDVDPKQDCAEWPVRHVLTAHDQAVSSIDWCPVTNKILSCAHDRTAFVWSQSSENAAPTDAWNPTLILLDAQMKHGFTCCRWSHSGQKLYVGGASTSVAIGKYDAESDWWRCSVFEPHCASVTCMAPSPALDTILATGSIDQTVKISSTFIKSIDDAESRLAKMGDALALFDVPGWVNSLAWSDEGTVLSVACHNSTVAIFYGASPTDFSAWGSHIVTLNILPLRSITFVSDHTIIGGGYDYYPVAIVGTEDHSSWHVESTGASAKAKETEKLSETQLARQRFQNQASMGTTESVVLPNTRHTNTISTVRKTGKNKFATSSLDGRVEFWDLSAMVKLGA
jgi:actin related protein 2/3 complex subunit 1A/1B